MKIGVDAGPLSEVDGKLVRAAARTHRATGLPIYSHTGNGVAALAQVAVLEDERAPLGAFVWVHAQNESDPAVHAQVARRGAWVSFDGVGAQSLERHLGNVLAMREARLLDRVLVSHDAGWYHVGEPDGGTYRPHDLIFTDFLPALRARGLSPRRDHASDGRESTSAYSTRCNRLNPRGAHAVRPYWCAWPPMPPYLPS